MNASPAKILIVDDEPNVLKALSRLLKAYATVTVESAEEALLIAEQQAFDLVISDYRMPGINGIDFLILFKRLQPDAIRVVLTGFADLEGAQHAINEAEVFRFINKPWSNLEIVHVVESGLAHKRMLLENRALADQVRAQQKLLAEKDALIRALEAEEPGITKVNWAADGSIILDDADLE
ncbi:MULTISPECIES: response regulator [Methylomonas]|uniref:Response regulator receiver protein n=1 Tax=Methylomonas koyamae TaxID=702114 RepID=A0A291INE0_9GAMM|nr:MULTISPECIES: response regulator [Methylomonas]ANE56958.1 response regulator receiver protein [Methylomonas sp. DH-1]ATG91915.1 response regulator receiver protein [Methylomonas koyamae]OAI28822.1 response regulator receiver protein [Methylomonas koyamae]